MNDFVGRIQAQREVIAIINERYKQSEELYGLSRGAIERWCVNNNVNISSELSKVLLTISDKLMFLANKSQQQVTDDYKIRFEQISKLTAKLKTLVN